MLRTLLQFRKGILQINGDADSRKVEAHIKL